MTAANQKWLSFTDIDILEGLTPSQSEKHNLFSDQNRQILCQVSDQNNSKAIPFRALHAYIAHVKDPPTPSGVYTFVDAKQIIICLI